MMLDVFGVPLLLRRSWNGQLVRRNPCLEVEHATLEEAFIDAPGPNTATQRWAWKMTVSSFARMLCQIGHVCNLKDELLPVLLVQTELLYSNPINFSVTNYQQKILHGLSLLKSETM